MAGLCISLAQPDPIPSREWLPRNRTGPAWLRALRSPGRSGCVLPAKRGRRCGRILDAVDIDAADIIGHDWGAAVAWLTATVHPDRVHKLVVLSVPHPLAPRTLRQREMAWYQLFFQFEGIAEAWLQHNDWALLRELLRGKLLMSYAT